MLKKILGFFGVLVGFFLRERCMNKKGLAMAALEHLSDIFCGVFSHFFQCSFCTSDQVDFERECKPCLSYSCRKKRKS